MYLRPLLEIQILAFLTTQIWACFRLRSFGLEFMTKLEALATSGYIPIPLPHEMSDYLHIGSLAKAGSFFTFTLGFTLGVVAFGGSFCLNRCRFSRPIRLGWTVFISAFFCFLLGFSPVGLLLLTAFFAWAHLAVRIPEAPFHKAALFSLIPLILVFAVYLTQSILLVRDYHQDFLLVRDGLLQNSWGRRVVTFYYWYSPLPTELITPPTKRTQVAIWTGNPLARAERSWLLKRHIYTVSTRKGADFAFPCDAGQGPAVLDAIKKETGGRSVKRLSKTISYSISVATPVAIMLLFLLATDRLFTLSKCYGIVPLLCVAFLSGLLIYRLLSQEAWESRGTLPSDKVEEVRHWVRQIKETGDLQTKDSFIGLLNSNKPAVRLWAATALAYLPSKDNVDILKTTARHDPIAIVRCKAISALSHQRDRRVIPFLVSRLKGAEDWYVKHYLVRALRRRGWIG